MMFGCVVDFIQGSHVRGTGKYTSQHFIIIIISLARNSICYIASYMLSSVCLSVTRVDQAKTVEVRIMQLSPQSSPMTIVSSWLTLRRNLKGHIGSGAPNKRGVEKIRNFPPISRRISLQKWCKIGP